MSKKFLTRFLRFIKNLIGKGELPLLIITPMYLSPPRKGSGEVTAVPY